MIRAFAIIVLLSLTVASGVAVVHARHEHRQQFVALTALERERDELNVEFGRLQLEQATLADAHRVERIARNDLGMKFPEASELRVVRP